MSAERALAAIFATAAAMMAVCVAMVPGEAQETYRRTAPGGTVPEFNPGGIGPGGTPIAPGPAAHGVFIERAGPGGFVLAPGPAGQLSGTEAPATPRLSAPRTHRHAHERKRHRSRLR
jgi:hypothetical protein